MEVNKNLKIEEKKSIKNEEPQNKKLKDDELNEVNGGGIAIRPSGNKPSDNGNLL